MIQIFWRFFFGVDTSLSIPFDDEQSGKEGEKTQVIVIARL
jgi:hypothetical protein